MVCCEAASLARTRASGIARRTSKTPDRALRITERLQTRSTWRAEGPDIPLRLLAEETVVFAAELAGTLVSNLKGPAGGIQTIDEHASARSLEAKLFLILKGAHGGQYPEMMVQRGYSHAGDFR